MSKTREIIGLLCLLTVVVCAEPPKNTFTIKGTYWVSKFDHHTRLSDEQRTTTASVVVTYEVINSSGEAETVELTSGSFVNNRFHFEGQIDKPTNVVITVQDGENGASTTSALIVPGGDEIEFCYVLFASWFFSVHNVHLIGTARLSEDATKKFTISGDFRDLDDHPPFIAVRIGWEEYQDGEFKYHGLSSVMANKRQFVLEADVEEAIVATLVVYSMSDRAFFSFIEVVLEPGTQLRVIANERGDDVIAIADRGRHKLLIDSWRQSDEYVKKRLDRDEAFARYSKEQGLPKLTPARDFNFNHQEANDIAVEKLPSESELSTETGVEDSNVVQIIQSDAVAQGPNPFEGCEHITNDEVRSTFGKALAMKNEPEYKVLDRELDEMRQTALQEIANDDDDPLNALLAMALGAYRPDSKNRNDAFPIYEKLTSSLEGDLEGRASLRRAILLRDIEKWDNDKKLVPGQRVPSFDLTSFEGSEFSLNDVMKENDVVLIDFWDSTCSSCSLKSTKMKQLYEFYKDKRFEIVGVSLDRKFNDWEESTHEHQPPWINLGEIEGWNGTVSKTFGVSQVPKTYLVDSHGCILSKDISTIELEEFLSRRIEPNGN